MNTAIGTIDPDRDTQILVEQTKTGYSHPQDFLFEDLGSNYIRIVKVEVERNIGNPSAITTDDTGSFDGSTMKRTSTGVKNINGKGIPRKQSMNMKLFSGSNGGKVVEKSKFLVLNLINCRQTLRVLHIVPMVPPANMEIFHHSSVVGELRRNWQSLPMN
jgi:hypothetical protein